MKNKRILFTSDLHMESRLDAYDDFSECIQMENPDVVVVAGDIGSALNAQAHMRALREAAGDRPLAVCLGNHDYWIHSHEDTDSQYPRLSSITEKFWAPAVKAVGATLLDQENQDFGEGFALVGGHGHFDLGQAEPNLKVCGRTVTQEDYLRGGMSRIIWNDFRYIPNCGKNALLEAAEQAEGIARRMEQAIAQDKRLILATHTCPWRKLNGHPLSGDEGDILSAYSGNSLVGAEIKKRAAHVDFLVCGHTHKHVPARTLYGVKCLNMGGDYGLFRGVIYSTTDKSIKSVGEPTC